MHAAPLPSRVLARASRHLSLSVIVLSPQSPAGRRIEKHAFAQLDSSDKYGVVSNFARWLVDESLWGERAVGMGVLLVLGAIGLYLLRKPLRTKPEDGGYKDANTEKLGASAS